MYQGTSADQDTRFSNKMSKLLKSQKFAPELDVLVEMAKVKIDVIKPWIATRVTELLGFEDEVLINFIYGLLDVKEADGKHLQIQLTGFMEKNTGRFMKELWALLTSAQNNLSGVPQQFLDAKAEETQKKKEEKDRIILEVLQRKEVQEKDAEADRQKRMSARDEESRAKLGKRRTGSPGRAYERKFVDDLGGGRNGKGGCKCSLSPRRPRSSSSSRGPSPVRRPYPRSISRSPAARRRRRSISPVRQRTSGKRYSPLPVRTLPRRRQSHDSRSPLTRRKTPPGKSPPLCAHSRTPPRISRRSPIHSPPARQHLGSRPPLRRQSPGASGSPRSSVGRRSLTRHQFGSRDQRFGPSRSPYQRRRRSPSNRDIGGSQMRIPYRNRGNPSQERGVRRNGYDRRDYGRFEREGNRLERRPERFEKRGVPDRRQLYNREHDRAATRESHESLGSGDRQSYPPELDGVPDLEPPKVDRVVERDIGFAQPSGRASPWPQEPCENNSDSDADGKGVKRKASSNEVVVASQSDEEDDQQAPKQQIALKGKKDVSDGGDASEPPASSGKQRAAKQRRRKERRLRKEERRRRREEKHRRREERRAAKAVKAAAAEVDEENGDASNLRRGNNNTKIQVPVKKPAEVYRSKDDENEDEQKRIEKELRSKALESLRAKKGVAC